MTKLELDQKIASLEQQGLTYDQIVAATQDDFEKWVYEPLPEEKQYFGDLAFTATTKSKMKLELLKSLSEGITIDNLTLNLADGTKLKVEVQDVLQADWEDLHG